MVYDTQIKVERQKWDVLQIFFMCISLSYLTTQFQILIVCHMAKTTLPFSCSAATSYCSLASMLAIILMTILFTTAHNNTTDDFPHCCLRFFNKDVILLPGLLLLLILLFKMKYRILCYSG